MKTIFKAYGTWLMTVVTEARIERDYEYKIESLHTEEHFEQLYVEEVGEFETEIEAIEFIRERLEEEEEASGFSKDFQGYQIKKFYISK